MPKHNYYFDMDNISFEFTTLNKKVCISSFKRDFPKSIIQGINEMANQGAIKELMCYSNAYKVAKYLISMGYTNIRLVDGTYRCLRMKKNQDTHRFIQYTNPEGKTRYYDPTIELIPKPQNRICCSIWSFDYTAVRVFEIGEIERFSYMAQSDAILLMGKYHIEIDYDIPNDNGLLLISTLDNNVFRFPQRDIYISPRIDDNGCFVSAITEYEKYLFNKVVAA